MKLQSPLRLILALAILTPTFASAAEEIVRLPEGQLELTDLLSPEQLYADMLGMDESDLVIDPVTSFPLQLFANGNVAQTVSLPPPSIVFQNVPVYLQWLVLDPTVVTGMATSQGGATVLY